jgi:glutathione S-transferase
MKLYSSPSSPFARKCLVIAHELGLALEVENVSPIGNAELRTHNPLGKVPVLIDDDGAAIYDSRVICEVLNHRSLGRLFPGEDLQRALTLQALADGICDSAVARIFESRRPPEFQHDATMTRYMLAITTGLDVLETLVDSFATDPTIGEFAVACALGYLDLRYADLAWRQGHPELARWFADFSTRASLQATIPEG